MKSVGLSRTVRLDWLDAVSSMCMAQVEPSEIRQRLFNLLETAQPGPTERERIVDTLVRAWVKADPELKAQGFEMLQQANTREDRVWLHYGMILAQYPFFRACQAAIGQIARTEEQVTRVAIKQRIAREMGNLGGNERAIERLFVTLNDWGVLIPDGKQFTIQRCVFPTSVIELEQWLLGCALRNYPMDGVPFNDLLALPELFPFTFSVRIDDLRASDLFDVQQQGLDLFMIQRKMASAGPARLI